MDKDYEKLSYSFMSTVHINIISVKYKTLKLTLINSNLYVSLLSFTSVTPPEDTWENVNFNFYSQVTIIYDYMYPELQIVFFSLEIHIQSYS